MADHFQKAMPAAVPAITRRSSAPASHLRLVERGVASSVWRSSSPIEFSIAFTDAAFLLAKLDCSKPFLLTVINAKPVVNFAVTRDEVGRVAFNFFKSF